MIVLAGLATLAAGLATFAIVFANSMSRGKFVCGGAIWAVWIMAAVLWTLVFVKPALAHDHNRPELNDWYKSLSSKHGPCCDGPSVDAVHLSDVDWETQNKDGSHYRARVPKTGADMEKARAGQSFESEWADVPDTAVIAEPNRAGVTLVWPRYGYSGRSIACFMPGSMT